jgi:hypothetical protein
VSITFLTVWQNVFGGDEAAKYIAAWLLFWLKNFLGSFAITLVALQSFRSRQYAAHMDAKEKQQVARDTQAIADTHHEGVTVKQTVTEEKTVGPKE